MNILSWDFGGERMHLDNFLSTRALTGTGTMEHWGLGGARGEMRMRRFCFLGSMLSIFCVKWAASVLHLNFSCYLRSHVATDGTSHSLSLSLPSPDSLRLARK